MRFDELTVGVPGQQVHIGFHQRMTVMCGMGADDRQSLVEALLQAASGGADNAELGFYDNLGRRLIIVRRFGRPEVALSDDSMVSVQTSRLPLPPIETLPQPQVIGPRELGLVPELHAGDEPPELSEAREMMAELIARIEAGRAVEKQAEAAERAAADVEHRIRAAQQGQARRRYARVLSDLERVRAEADALRAGPAGAARDDRLATLAEQFAPAVARWQAAGVRVADLTRSFGDRPRLDPEVVAAAVSIPDHVPADLERLIGRLDEAVAVKKELTARLFELASSRLPEPSDPAVIDLARLDQGRLWTLHGATVAATAALEAERLALGDLGSSAEITEIVAAIEAAHAETEARSARARRLFNVGVGSGGAGATLALAGATITPALAVLGAVVAAGGLAAMLVPKRKANAAKAAETEVLGRVGASSYLNFHLRRVETLIDPDAQRRLQLIAAAHRSALDTWHALVGDVTPERAGGIERDVAAYAEALARLGASAKEIEAVRDELADQAGPRVEAARRELLTACSAYDIDDHPTAIADTIRHRIALGHAARLQHDLDLAEERLNAATGALDELVNEIIGPDLRPLAARVETAHTEVTGAARRRDGRAAARPAADVEADLVRLLAEEQACRCQEWDTVTIDEAVEPDLDALGLERDRTLALARRAREAAPDLTTLIDRQAAIARRIAALEQAAAGLAPHGLTVELPVIYDRLLGRLALARHGGVDGDHVPALLDDPFVHVPAGHKWDLLDMVERLSEGGQIVYLTEDPYVAAWAKRRADAGAIRMLATST